MSKKIHPVDPREVAAARNALAAQRRMEESERAGARRAGVSLDQYRARDKKLPDDYWTHSG